MGTRFEVVLSGDVGARLRAVGEAALAEIEDWDARLSLFRRESLLSRINANAHCREVDLDQETFDLLVACREVWRGSGGAFDVTVGPLMPAWGFRDRHEGKPDKAEVAAAAEIVGFDGVELDESRRSVRFTRPGMAIDLGAIGKGHALDAAARVVRDNGVSCGLLQGGTSSVVGLGAPPDERGWRVAVGMDPGAPVAVVRDAALSVSAPHGRMVESDGRPLGHVLDPRTAAPTEGARLAAVIARGSDAARAADAWSTALLVLRDRPPGMPAGLVTALDTGASEAPVWTIEGPDAAVVFELPSASGRRSG